MAQKIIINGRVLENVDKIKAPLANDTTKTAVFPDTSDATAVADSIKNGDTAYVDGVKVIGTMPIITPEAKTIDAKDDTIEIEEGYHDGSGTVKIADSEKVKIVPENIRDGITILGVEGTMSTTEGANPQSVTVTPSEETQTIIPDSSAGYNYLSQVTVNPIPEDYIVTTDADAIAADIVNGKSAYVNGVKVIGTHTDPVFTLDNGVLTIV